MHIAEVISYGSAWSSLLENRARELEEIKQALSFMTNEQIELSAAPRDLRFITQSMYSKTRGCLEEAFLSRGWKQSQRSVEGPSTRPISLHSMGYIKNRVSVALQLAGAAVNRWLYTICPVAIREGYIDIPACVMLLRDTEQELFDRPGPGRGDFERTRDEFIALAPLSHKSPFVILGASLTPKPLRVIELPAESDTTGRQIVINRSIEFPPQYHQAGLGILNYFGAVLREKYPDHNATVKIEQDGLTVRLIVESENGDRQIIEKALEEYELVVRGEAAPEDFFQSRTKVLELKNELRIAHLRVESQRDLIEFQGQELATLKHLISNVLGTARTAPVSITVNPNFHITASTSSASTFDLEIPEISESLQLLIERAGEDPAIHRRLLDMDESVGAISSKTTADEVKNASGLQKLRRFLEDASQTGDAAGQFIRKVTGGIEVLQNLAKKYNAIAAWCGAPQVPPILLGK